MSYLALYRQWRPKVLGEIVGQKHVTETLRNAVLAGRVSHAYLFCGPRGTGKTSTAKVLARIVNCLAPQGGEPCNQCKNCLGAISGSTMDIIEIDAASNRGIDEIRDLKENIKYFPSVGLRRVYIVDEVHMLTNEAFNALLKTLEEPPSHVLFILATTEPHKVPLTILSRCQRFDFRPIPEHVIAGRLKEIADNSGFNVDEEAVKAITRASGGSLRDALSVLDQALLLSGTQSVTDDVVHGILGTVREEALIKVAKGIADKAAPDLLEILADIISEGKDLYLFVGELTEFLRGLLISRLDRQEDTTGVDTDRLIRIIDLLLEAEQVMRRSAHPRVVLELAMIRACREIDFRQDELLKRIEHLEQALNNLKGEFKGTPKMATKPLEVPAERDGKKLSLKGNTTKDIGLTKEAVPFVLEQPAEQPPIGETHKKEQEINQETQIINSAVYDLDQIKKWWPDLLELVKKKSIAVYNYLCQVWPAEVKEHCLILGVPDGDIFSRQMIEQEATKQMLSQTIFSFTRQNWQVRCNFYQVPPPGWEERGGQQLDCTDTISLFQAEEVSVEEEDN